MRFFPFSILLVSSQSLGVGVGLCVRPQWVGHGGPPLPIEKILPLLCKFPANSCITARIPILYSYRQLVASGIGLWQTVTKAG